MRESSLPTVILKRSDSFSLTYYDKNTYSPDVCAVFPIEWEITVRMRSSKKFKLTVEVMGDKFFDEEIKTKGDPLFVAHMISTALLHRYLQDMVYVCNNDRWNSLVHLVKSEGGIVRVLGDYHIELINENGTHNYGYDKFDGYWKLKEVESDEILESS